MGPKAWQLRILAAAIDIILMQIRHVQYHVGHFNSILREQGKKVVDWTDYFG